VVWVKDFKGTLEGRKTERREDSKNRLLEGGKYRTTERREGKIKGRRKGDK